MMTTKTQKKNSKKQSNDSKTNGKTQKIEQKPLKLNLVHAIFLHGMLSDLYSDAVDENFKNFVSDIIHCHEAIIDQSENQELKEKMKFKPFKSNYDETT